MTHKNTGSRFDDFLKEEGIMIEAYIPYGDSWKAQAMHHTKKELLDILGSALANKDEEIEKTRDQVRLANIDCFINEAKITEAKSIINELITNPPSEKLANRIREWMEGVKEESECGQ